MKSSGIGGQAVMEGIMMRNGSEYSVAVRKENGEIEVFDFKGPFDFYPWYRQGNKEWNSVNVIMVEYFEKE